MTAHFRIKESLLCFLLVNNTCTQASTAETKLSQNTDEQAVENILIIGKHPGNSAYEYASGLSMMSADAIRAWNIHSADDLVASMANVDARARSPMSANISIRSVGSENWHINANQGVVQAIDDTGIQGAYASKLAMFDLQGIAVYKGPQTALFGINSTGGAINFETIKPVMNEFEANTSARIGRDNLKQFNAAVNLPFTQNLALRMALSTKKRDPLWFNAFSDTMMGSVDQNGFRTHLKWRMSDKQSLLLTYQYGSDDGSRVPYLGIGYWQGDGENVADGHIVDLNAPLDCKALLPSSSQSFQVPSNCVTLRPFSSNQAVVGGAGDWYVTFDPADDISKVNFETYKANYYHVFEGFELTVISTRDSVKSDYIESLSNNPFGLAFMPSQAADKSYWSHELRLNSLDGADHLWMFGMSLSDSDDYFGTVITRTDAGGAPFGIVPAVSIDQSNKTLSTFASFDFRLNEKWSSMLNVRYSKNDQAGVSTTNVLAKTDNATPAGTPLPSGLYINRSLLTLLTQEISGPCPPNVGGFPCELQTPVELSSHLLGGKLGLSYAFSDQHRFYAHFSRGFLAGAFDTRALAAFVGTADDPVEPETLDAFELGWKHQTPKLSMSLASFYYQWNDKQTFDLNNAGNPAFLNIPQTKLLGIDGDAKWQISQNWLLNVNFGAVKSEITDAGSLRFTEEGKELSHTPRWSHSLLLSYYWENKFGESTFSLSHRFKSRVYDNNANTDYNRLEAQKLWNVSMRHQFAAKDGFYVSIESGIENITGQKYCTSLTDNNSLSYTVQCRPNAGKAQWYLGVRIDI